MSSSFSSSSDLYRPDSEPLSQKEKVKEKADFEGDEDEDDELEALRNAALRSMKPKKSFCLERHPNRSNLVSIVLLETSESKNEVEQGSTNFNKDENKFSRFKDVDSSSTSSSPSSTLSSSFLQKEAKPEIAEEEDDVLHIQASEEIDEFTQFLNQFENELLDKKNPITTTTTTTNNVSTKGNSSSCLTPKKKKTTSRSKELGTLRGSSAPRSTWRPVSNEGKKETKEDKSSSLPPPSRSTEKILVSTSQLSRLEARKRKFENNTICCPSSKKVISLTRQVEGRRSKGGEESSEFISLNLDDTLDMFEDNHSGAKYSQSSKSQKKSVFSNDLRAQLRQRRTTEKIFRSSKSESPSLNISSGSENDEDFISSSSSPKGVYRPSILSRLGDPVQYKKENDAAQCLSLRKEWKKDRKERKRAKKEKKKEFKKIVKMAKLAKVSVHEMVLMTDEEEEDEEKNEKSEILQFFEKENNSFKRIRISNNQEEEEEEDLLKKMKKKSEARLLRLAEIEADKLLHR